MSSRYDSRTTTFSPEGRLYQVEYAVEAISHAPMALAIVTDEGIALAAERPQTHPLLDSEQPSANSSRNYTQHRSGDKVIKLADHVCCAVAGITSDAHALVDVMRTHALRHEYNFGDAIAIEDLCRVLCDQKQGYTQYGGVRPFGVSFLLAGWDRFHGYQLYHTDPSGNYTSWKAYACGQNDSVAFGLLKQSWKENMTLRDGLLLGVKILAKAIDVANLSASRLELATLSREKAPALDLQGGKLCETVDLFSTGTSPAGRRTVFSILSDKDAQPIVDEAERLRREEEKAEDES